MDHQQSIRFTRMKIQRFYLIEQSSDQHQHHFKISGSTANLYHVVIDFQKEKMNTFLNCNCPDSTGWARRYNVKCKHCCFVWTKILGLDPKLITKLDPDLIQQIYEKCQHLIVSHRYINPKYQQRYQELIDEPADPDQTQINRYTLTKTIQPDDNCPICFDSLSNHHGPAEDHVSQCPTCTNLVHTECIAKWLNMSQKNCVYCRSPWKNFSTKQKKKNPKDDYLNLS